MLPSERYERQLRVWWQRLNEAVFGGALLVPPRFVIDKALNVNALRDSTRTTIRFSHHFVRVCSWWTVLEALKHEMAQQYASDVVGARDESERRKVHQMLCERFGLCEPPARDAGDGLPDEQLEEIRALLGRGDSTNDRSALSRASDLMRESATPLKNDAEAFSALAIGPVITTMASHEVRVARILERVLGVKSTWVESLDPGGHDGRQLEVVGYRRQVQAAERLHSLLLEEAGRRWTERGSDRTGGWLGFLDREFARLEEALPAEADAGGGEQTRDGELMEFCLVRSRSRSNFRRLQD